MIKFFKQYYLYILFFIFFLLMNLCIPFGGDDWAWREQYTGGIINEIYDSILAYPTFNGRILHNFSAKFFANYTLFWAFFMAFIYSITIFLMAKIFEFEKDKKSIIAIFVMFLCVPVLFRKEVQFYQTVSVAYAIVTSIFFLYLYLIKSLNENKIKLFNNNK